MPTTLRWLTDLHNFPGPEVKKRGYSFPLPLAPAIGLYFVSKYGESTNIEQGRVHIKKEARYTKHHKGTL